LNQENLDEIFSKIPRGAEVSILSVVGGFRSGKSFILNLILRYLRSKRVDELGEEWMTEEGDKISEGNCNAANSTRGAESSPGSDTPTSSADAPLSFAWRGGDSRMTTGIWMWSEPFMRKSKKFQGAILVMDTQGMFDNQTSMNMTAQIFGLSTLVSAHQIYNVEKMLGEDKLQHLALFSEYGRMAFKPSAEVGTFLLCIYLSICLFVCLFVCL
jgi:atlastin